MPAGAPVELAHSRRPAAPGITARSAQFRDDELCTVRTIRCTTPARTAYDLARRLPLESAVIRVDALLNATGATTAEVQTIAARYPGARGIRRFRTALDLVDSGAESPQETRLRLLLVRSGLPRPVTQIRVGNRRIDMGWPDHLVGVEYTASNTGQTPSSTPATSSVLNSSRRGVG